MSFNRTPYGSRPCPRCAQVHDAPPGMAVCLGAPVNSTLSRTLRARDNGAADTIRCLRGAKRRTTTRIKPTSGGKAYGFTASRGLSAAPLGV